MALLRRVLGETLRGQRLRQQRTLREVSGAARVSLGYLSEVERGQKEASSELLSAICDALELRLSDVLGEVTEGMRRAEQGVPVRELSRIRRMPAVLPAPDRRSGGPDHEAALEPAATDGAEAAPVAEVPAVPVAEVPAVPVAEVSQVSGVSPVSRRRVLEPAGGDSREVLAAVLGAAGPGRVIAA
jgi:transcriptional regulator with XRE-family HTH domain